MKKASKYMRPAVLITVFVLLAGIAVMNAGDAKAGIAGNKIGFGYPSFSVRLLMGKPDKVSRIENAGLTAYHYYDRTFFGQQGAISYHTHLFRVDRIILEINIDDDGAYALFDTISQSIESEYAGSQGYYCSSVVQEEDGKLIQNLGVNKGAVGISFTLSYLNGELRLDGMLSW